LFDFSASSRKTLIYLILTLNHIYPDYDFSQLRAHHFRKEGGLARAEELIDTHLLEVSKVRSIDAVLCCVNILQRMRFDFSHVVS
jgi:hypothetical protein